MACVSLPAVPQLHVDRRAYMCVCCVLADDDNDAVLFEKIKKGNYDADDPIWENISAEAKALVAQLLTVDTAKRLTAEQALNHPWVQGKSGGQQAPVHFSKVEVCPLSSELCHSQITQRLKAISSTCRRQSWVRCLVCISTACCLLAPIRVML